MLHRYLVPHSHCFSSLSKMSIKYQVSPHLLGSFSNLLSPFYLLNQAELIPPFIYIKISVINVLLQYFLYPYWLLSIMLSIGDCIWILQYLGTQDKLFHILILAPKYIQLYSLSWVNKKHRFIWHWVQTVQGFRKR